MNNTEVKYPLLGQRKIERYSTTAFVITINLLKWNYFPQFYGWFIVIDIQISDGEPNVLVPTGCMHYNNKTDIFAGVCQKLVNVLEKKRDRKWELLYITVPIRKIQYWSAFAYTLHLQCIDVNIMRFLYSIILVCYKYKLFDDSTMLRHLYNTRSLIAVATFIIYGNQCVPLK